MRETKNTHAQISKYCRFCLKKSELELSNTWKQIDEIVIPAMKAIVRIVCFIVIWVIGDKL